MGWKELLGLSSIAITVIADLLYIKSIFRGSTRPHAFSWIVWTLLTATAFFVQSAEKAGPGAWSVGFTSVVCFLIAVLALFRGEKNVTRSDWAAFAGALVSLYIWQGMNNPLGAIVMVTVVEVFAFYPTFRKSWHKPREELALMYSLDVFKYVLALLALENYTLTTALYQAFIVVIQSGFVAMLLWRRRVLSC